MNHTTPTLEAENSDPIDGETVTNILSFDVEHWYSATLLRDEVTDPVDRIEESLGIVRNVLEEFDVHATFFVVGELALEYPDLIGELADDGHEVASHGHTHTPLFELDRAGFERELERSADALHDVTGYRPIGFRAPNFSVTRRTEWAFPALVEAEFQYDSSVFPTRTPMYGVSGAPIHPYLPRRTDSFVAAPSDLPSDTTSSFVEFPLAVTDSTFPVPIAGGFYARLLPVSLIERGISRLNDRGFPGSIYFHPWEFNPAVATDEPKWHKRFVSFHGINRLEAKLRALLTTFEFDTTQEVLGQYDQQSRYRQPRLEPRLDTFRTRGSVRGW